MMMAAQSPYPSNFDNVTHANVYVDYAHHEIHEGSHYVVTDTDSSIDIASPKYWHIKTADSTKWCHLISAFRSDGAGTLEFFENPTTTADGTALTAINSNRNSSNTAVTLFYKDPTVTADGTALYSFLVGSEGNPVTAQGGMASRESEFILKQNEQYVLKFTPSADGTVGAILFEFYEHTNKEDL